MTISDEIVPASDRRQCGRCREFKSLDDFYKAARRKDGLQFWCKSCGLEHQNSRPAAKRKYHRKYWLRSRYGLTPQDYDDLLASQGGGCAGCLVKPDELPDWAIHVDHDHATGKVRGILCHACNTRALKGAKENPATLRRLADYIERTR